MNKPNTYVFEDLGFTMRLTDLRPKFKSIQLNVYNPNDTGHSLVFPLNASDNFEFSSNLQELRYQLANNILVEAAAKALKHFEACKAYDAANQVSETSE